MFEFLLGSEPNTAETGPIEPLVDGKTHTITLTQANGIVENAKYTGLIGSEESMSPISFRKFVSLLQPKDHCHVHILYFWLHLAVPQNLGRPVVVYRAILHILQQ